MDSMMGRKGCLEDELSFRDLIMHVQNQSLLLIDRQFDDNVIVWPNSVADKINIMSVSE